MWIAARASLRTPRARVPTASPVLAPKRCTRPFDRGWPPNPGGSQSCPSRRASCDSPYRETQYVLVSQLNRKNGVDPQVGDDDWLTVVQSEGGKCPMVRLRTLTLHPGDWLPRLTEAVRLRVPV